jgi:molybdenum cofactor biosynthesis protein MoaC
MVDVTGKGVTKRMATAIGRIYIPQVAYELVTSTIPDHDSDSLQTAKDKARRKGDVLSVAQLAAIMGCKRTSELIPLCHPLSLTHISVTLTPEPPLIGTETGHSILCESTVSCEGKTGVEMEALTAVSVGLLTVWDMLKAVAGKEMRIGDIMVIQKEGGRSGGFRRA